MTTCSEYAAMKAQAEADLARAARAQVERDAAEIDVDAAEIAMTEAMNEWSQKQIFLAQKQAEVDAANNQVMFITMMMQMQGC